jgi:DNA polymerase-3 subunit delta
MKIDARQIEGFLRDPGAARVVLLFGDDVGLIRERARRLVLAVAGSTDDPFRVVELDREAIAAVPDEMASVPMTGGRRVVRLRDATETAVPVITRVLDGRAEGFLVIEAPGLASRGKLRGLVEKAPGGAAIGCYPLEGRALEQEIRAGLGAAQVGVDSDALGWLAEHLGADQAVTRGEVEKLAMYAGPGGHVDIEMAQRCVGDLAGLSLEDALFAATAGDVAAADRALELAMAEGAAPVAVLRTALAHLQKLQRAREAMQRGASATEAAKGVRPPLFYRREGPFVQALQVWNAAALDAGCQRMWEAERACKRTGAPDDVLCRSAVLGLAQRAAVARRR